MSDIPVLRTRANRFLAFLAGTAGALVVYCVFLVRHMDLVSSHMEGLEGGGKIVMAACLFAIAFASGVFATALKPRGLGGAFAMGLALPALIFAVDAGIGASGPGGEAGQFSRAAGLILSPVGTVARLERAEVEKGVADLEGALDQASRDKQEFADRADGLEAERKTAVEEGDELRESQATLRTELDAARGDATRLRADLTTSGALVDELRNELSRRPAAVPIRLTASADPETVRAGASTTILVTARSESGDPLSGAAVKLEAEGGVFGNTRTKTVTGDTDAEGNFRVEWRTGAVDSYAADTPVAIHVEISKPGHVPDRIELAVRVVVPPPPEKPVPVPPVEPPPGRETPPDPATPSEVPGPVVKPPPPPDVPIGMVAEAVGEPSTVAAGASTTIRIMVRTPDGKPIPGARVELGTSGGSFEKVRGGRVTGVTDSKGIFRVLWRSLPAELYTSGTAYEFRARITKKGHVWAKAKTTVRIAVAVPRRSIPLLVWEHADPARLTAGGTSMITVTAKTPTGLPIPGATVNLGVPGGTFEGTNENTATGVTDEKGAFRVRWRTGPAADYEDDRRFDMTVEVTKPGYALARSEMRIEVRARTR